MASSLDIAGINKRFGKGDKSVEVLRKVDIHVAVSYTHLDVYKRQGKRESVSSELV